VYCLESAIEFCDSYLGIEEVSSELQPVEPRAGRGIGAIEAPRGTLFHEYNLDDEGKVTAANVVTPTAQNLANVERDLRSSGGRLQQAGAVRDADLKQAFEMVARAYDPCISCSVHLVRLDG
jgi:coenzyme F420-reducing hydrogenase alpha subunit